MRRSLTFWLVGAIAGTLAILLTLSYPMWLPRAARQATERERVLYYFADQTGETALCDRISWDAFERYSPIFAGGGASFLRSDCYQGVAGARKDARICWSVRPLVDFDPLSSGHSALACRPRALRGDHNAPGPSDTELIRLFEQMGYVIDNLHLEGVIEPAIKVRDVYVINAHEAKTVAAAKALLAGEAGPVDADEAGYLASLISAATRDPEWCEHVSADLVLPPNPAPFRDWCLFTLANDIKDTRVCDLMTPVAKEQKVIEAKAKGVRREIAEQLSLQHACKWQITNGTNLTYGPEVPTNPAQIQRLVARLGIAMPSAHDWSASEQAAYYGRFLWALWPHENDAVHRAARSKLVERLLALEGRL